MGAKEAERPFLDRITEYLLSLPYDLKILQEAATDPDLDRAAREVAVGTIVHTILPQEGDSPARYVDDVLYVRAALQHIGADGTEGAKAFSERFGEVYGKLEEDVRIFSGALGDLWPWLTSKLLSFPKHLYKGKKTEQFLDDQEAALFLYDEGLEFQTNYPVNEEQVKNKIRRIDQVVDILQKRRAEEAKKKA